MIKYKLIEMKVIIHYFSSKFKARNITNLRKTLNLKIRITKKRFNNKPIEIRIKTK